MAVKKDSILAHTVARVAVAGMKPGQTSLSAWDGVKAVPKATRVAGFLTMWAFAERKLGRELEGVEDYREFWNESERSAYRHQAECRSVWGEENFRPLIDALTRTMAENERRVRERLDFNAGRAMSMEVSLDAVK
jgi:hypothetical protein